VGVNWRVTMISAKFLGTQGGTTANAIRAIDYFTDLKVRHGSLSSAGLTGKATRPTCCAITVQPTWRRCSGSRRKSI
jgi:hypothetical protein